MIIVIFFILGLIVGSFLNVVVYRLNLAESLMGRSMCPECKVKIRWYDNVPLLSFALLRAQCRDCGGRISWEYPMVEFFTGIVFALTGGYFFSLENSQSWAEVIFLLVLFSLMMVIFAYDLKFMEIPMLVLWLGVGWVAIYYLFSDWRLFGSLESIESLKLYSGIIGGFVAFSFFFFLVFVSKEKWMGMGDAYLAILLGFFLGWPKIFLGLLLAFFLGAVVSVVLVLVKEKSMKSQIPFAPFLIAGTVFTIFVYEIFPQIKYYLW